MTLKSKLPKLPAIGLVVSGGHTNLFYIKSFKQFYLLGQTRDDAVGEAFDKVAKILNLGYPGGPIIDKLAKDGGNTRVRFACAELPDSFDFSFSGIKTAVLYHHRAQRDSAEYSAPKIAYAFQDSVVDVLVKKCMAACVKKKCGVLLVGGGVACNSMLRERLASEGKNQNIDVFFPPLELCLDNAAMIAGLGYHANKN